MFTSRLIKANVSSEKKVGPFQPISVQSVSNWNRHLGRPERARLQVGLQFCCLPLFTLSALPAKRRKREREEKRSEFESHLSGLPTTTTAVVLSIRPCSTSRSLCFLCISREKKRFYLLISKFNNWKRSSTAWSRGEPDRVMPPIFLSLLTSWNSPASIDYDDDVDVDVGL